MACVLLSNSSIWSLRYGLFNAYHTHLLHCRELVFSKQQRSDTYNISPFVLQHNVWLEDAFDRATQLYLSYYRSIPKSLERSTAHKLMLAMLNHDERFVEPSPHSLQKLTLQSVKDAVMNQFVGGNMEVCDYFFLFVLLFSLQVFSWHFSN